ncbi:MAG: hypothetical protein AMJ73_08550 [candidate division Zixibacteria bacterium SM1_73]|nr:MAG: hypothetical protein AMJ73_08550 [candidate division Zixibacteria bacterium SM1_73]
MYKRISPYLIDNTTFFGCQEEFCLTIEEGAKMLFYFKSILDESFLDRLRGYSAKAKVYRCKREWLWDPPALKNGISRFKRN